MDAQLIIGAILGLLISYAIIYFAISNAMEQQRKMDQIRTNLLVAMARKAGVTEDEIKQAFKV